MSSNSSRIGDLKKVVRFKLAALENEKAHTFGEEKGYLSSSDGPVHTEILIVIESISSDFILR